MKAQNINLITPTQIEKLKIIRDVYLENIDASRVNNSRTKLTKNFSKNLIFRLENMLFEGELTDEARDFLETTLSSPAKVEKTNKPKI